MSVLSADQARFVDELAVRTRMAVDVAAAWVAAASGWGTTRADHDYVGAGGGPSVDHAARRAAGIVNRHQPEVRNAGAVGAGAQLDAIGAMAWTPAQPDQLRTAHARIRRPQLEATPRRRREGAKAGAQSIEDLARLAVGVGIPTGEPLVLAVSIALAESGGNPLAHALTSREDSRGLWQINVRAHPTRADDNLYDPRVNAQAMAEISSGGTNWRPWSTYTNGRWRQFEGRVRDKLTVDGTGTIPGISGGTVDPTDPADVARLGGTVASFFGFDKLAAQYFQIVITGLFTLGGLALVAMGLFRLTGTDPKAALAKGSAVASAAALTGATGGAAAPALAAAAL